jgi:lipid-binding SYLF domain-containing protein
MNKENRMHSFTLRGLTVFVTVLLFSGCAMDRAEGDRASAVQLENDARSALEQLIQTTPVARELNRSAYAVLIFPNIVKGGLIIGGQYGNGILFKNGSATAQYNVVGASYGLQAGAQSFSYALFFLSNAALSYLDRSEGWEVGVGPTVVVMDEGAAKSFSTTTARKDVYAVIFGQSGLMAGIGLQGAKITRSK